jgi:hypothetical protein
MEGAALVLAQLRRLGAMSWGGIVAAVQRLLRNAGRWRFYSRLFYFRAHAFGRIGSIEIDAAITFVTAFPSMVFSE